MAAYNKFKQRKSRLIQYLVFSLNWIIKRNLCVKNNLFLEAALLGKMDSDTDNIDTSLRQTSILNIITSYSVNYLAMLTY